MPILQTILPANRYDHDYLSHHPEELFLSSMNTGSVPGMEEQRKRFEKRTQGQSTNKTWFEERTFRLQSSNFGRICKTTDRTSFENLAKSFLTPRHVDTPATRHGRKYEEVAVRKYEEQ